MFQPDFSLAAAQAGVVRERTRTIASGVGREGRNVRWGRYLNPVLSDDHVGESASPRYTPFPLAQSGRCGAAACVSPAIPTAGRSLDSIATRATPESSSRGR
jgi:hypothetical protein